MTKAAKVIIGVVAGGVLVVVLFVVFLFNIIFGLTAGVVDTGEEFMKKLQARDYAAATTLLAPSLQKEVEAQGGLQTMAEGYALVPTEWSISSRSIRNSTGQMEGNVTTADGRTRPYRFVMEEQGDKWRLVGFHVYEK